MHVLFDIKSETGNYPIALQRRGMEDTFAQMRQAVVIADTHFAGELAAHGISVIALPANEGTKSLDTIGAIIVKLREAGAHRNSHLWAVGGGVIQDVAGFIASIYMRGIKWTYLPTTLLAMTDSCIGGKSSINVGAFKNIVGTFNTPDKVIIDPQLTKTLSVEQKIAGLVEAAKICFCRDDACFTQYMALAPDASASTDTIEAVILLSLQAKKWFIEIDEFDHAERLLLNFGHTFGHALEGASGYRISHGIAVGVGMLCAIELSRATHKVQLSGRAIVLEKYLKELLAAVPQLMEILQSIDAGEILKYTQSDKKHGKDYYSFIIVDEKEHSQLVRLPRNEQTDQSIISAFKSSLENF